ncbi:MAG: inositol monophosphatase [Spirochaetes bacterium]|nr:inositol monophosphatase [Spirochaetota bacterium]
MKNFLINLVKKTGRYQIKCLNDKYIIKNKPDSSFATEVDIASEKILIDEILKKFPDSIIISEETGITNKDNKGLKWIIDPIDGTMNYVHKLPVYSISIGVLENDILKFGIVYNPAMKELFYAEKGKGAFFNNRRIYVSRHDRLQNGLFGTGFYYTKDKEELLNLSKMFVNVQRESLGVRRPGAASIDLAWVACGRYEAYWEYGVQSWDITAGVLIVEEAQGKVTKINGDVHDLFGRNILASNGLVHDRLIEILNK